MRMLLVFALLTLAPPAFGAGWGHYVNERFGVEVDVPPGFVAQPPPANGDGLGFRSPTAELRAYGSFIQDTDFEGEFGRWIGYREQDGWAVTYQSTTPGWAVFSGKKGDRIFYSRAIPICGGSVIGAYEIEYSATDIAAFDPVIARLSRSLKDSGSGWQC